MLIRNAHGVLNQQFAAIYDWPGVVGVPTGQIDKALLVLVNRMSARRRIARCPNA